MYIFGAAILTNPADGRLMANRDGAQKPRVFTVGTIAIIAVFVFLFSALSRQYPDLMTGPTSIFVIIGLIVASGAITAAFKLALISLAGDSKDS
jgi:uncharacterized membrane protein YczE